MSWFSQNGCACSSVDCHHWGCRLKREGKAPAFQPMPQGCICPPGSNKDCENPACPRKPMQKPAP
jgi:hypothetical protein